MKFGGTSVADAERILAVAAIIEQHRSARPVVVLSALAGVTDLLERAIDCARRNDREGLEDTLDDMERRHRWALSGTVGDSGTRHDLSLELDALFEDLRQLLRSVRILGEVTPRAADTLLAFGELLSTKIATAAFFEAGLPALWIDPREVMITDRCHGAASPDLEAVRVRCDELIRPALGSDRIPVLGGFVGASPVEETTTLGRGGSDTSAAVLGAALGAKEIQIWTDVPGLMTADPRVVAGARRLEQVSFFEAAELAYYGARVLHPASIAPAVQRSIPVRVLSSLEPGGEGTLVLDRPDPRGEGLASVASRAGVSIVRITGKRMQVASGFMPRVLELLHSAAIVPEVVVSSEVAVSVAVSGDRPTEGIIEALASEASVEVISDRAIVCVVGSGLAHRAEVRRRVLGALETIEPEIVAMGGSGFSVSAVVPEGKLEHHVRELHRRFFE